MADLLLRMYKDSSSGASKALLYASSQGSAAYCGSLADALLILAAGVGRRIGRRERRGGRWGAGAKEWRVCGGAGVGRLGRGERGLGGGRGGAGAEGREVGIPPSPQNNPSLLCPPSLASGMRQASSSTRRDVRMRLLALFSDLGLRSAGNAGTVKVGNAYRGMRAMLVQACRG